MNVLELEGVSKSFGGLQALQSVSMEAKKGLITALIGPNGAGKTTLLNVINGLLRADAGVIRLEGREITHQPAHEIAKCGVSRTFQILKGLQQQTVLENLMVGRHVNTRAGIVACLFGSPGSRSENHSTEKAAIESLELFDLSHHAQTPLSVLPHGVQRLVEITRAMMSEPRLLLLDEPTSGLNPREVEVLLHTLKSVRQRGVTILLIEHNMRLVMDVADWVVVLNFGQKLTEGPPSEVTANAAVVEAYLGRKFRAAAS